MAQISLRAYNREISSLIDSGQIDEAIAHCQYILQTYPKYIETYRLLGKAYLEGQQHKEAIDVFQRVLTVAADDFITHVGMSIIREDEGKLDAAIWHMERAFEVQPSNQAIQDELKQLYGKRDGTEPQKIRLTRGALCRMYARGNQYRQAVAEIKSLLAEAPDRVDLEILLARMYYNLNMKVEATELCGRLLSKYPFCLEANRIMLKILTDSGKKAETDPYRQRIISMDPYESQVNDEFPTSEKVPEDLISIEKLVYDPNQKPNQQINQASAPEEAEPAPDWLISDLAGEDVELGEKGFTRILDATNLPADSQSSEVETPTEPEVQESAPILEEKVEFQEIQAVPESPTDIPEMIKTATQPVEMESIEDQLPDWLKDTEKTPEGTEASIPDWLKSSGWAAAGSITPEEPPSTVIHVEQEVEAPEVPIVPAEIPDWVQGLAPVTQEEPSAEKPVVQEGEIPAEVNAKLNDWLSGTEPVQEDMRSGGTASLHLPDEEPSDAATPEWLSGLDDQGKSEKGQPVVFASEDSSSNPQETAQPRVIYPQPPQTDKLDLEEEFPAAGGTSILSPEDVPDWLQDLTASPDEKMETTPEVTHEEPTTITPELPVEEPKPATVAPIVSLEEPTRPSPRREISVPEVVTTTLAPEEALPDWLPDITKEPVPSTTATLSEESVGGTQEAPGWLNILDQEEGEAPAAVEDVTTEQMQKTSEPIDASLNTEILKEEEKPTTSILPPNPQEQGEELPEWLKELDGYPEGTSPISDATETTSDEFPDWLKGFSESDTNEQVPITPASLEEPVEDEGEMPGWLSDLNLKGTSVESSAVDVPDWLRGLGPEPTAESPVEQPIDGVPPVVEQTSAEIPADEVLSSAETPVAEAQPADEIPDWLKSLQPEVTVESGGEKVDAEAPSAEGIPEAVTESEFTEQAANEIPALVEETATVTEVEETAATVSSAEAVEILETEPEQSVEEPAPEVIEPVVAETVETTETEAKVVIPTELEPGEKIIEEAQPEGEQTQATEEVPVLAQEEPSVISEPEITATEPETESVQPIVEETIQPEPESQLAAEEKLVEPEPKTSLLEVTEETPTTEYDRIFQEASKAIESGDLEDAEDQFTKLIKVETLLDKIVETLTTATESYPTDSGLWMTLGDAFGRSGKLQNALDAYTKAEEYLQ